MAGWGTGSTGLSRRTHRFYLPGKCRVFPRKRFTFPRGLPGYRLYRPLSRHLPFPPPGKVPGFPAKTVHFPPWPAGVPALQASLAALAVSTSRESAGNFRENGSLSPVACRGTGSTGLSRRTHRFHLPGKCREFPRKRFTFPRGGSFSPGVESSGEVQQGMLGEVLSIQALWKRASAGLGVKWQFYG